jgi:hypothetical protein
MVYFVIFVFFVKMLRMFPQIPPPDDFKTVEKITTESSIEKLKLEKKDFWGVRSHLHPVTFWEALYNPASLFSVMPLTEEELIEGIKIGKIVGLDESDRVVSTLDESVELVTPGQWAERRNLKLLKEVIKQHEQQVSVQQQLSQTQGDLPTGWFSPSMSLVELCMKDYLKFLYGHPNEDGKDTNL